MPVALIDRLSVSGIQAVMTIGRNGRIEVIEVIEVIGATDSSGSNIIKKARKRAFFTCVR
jgi:hypothetical protein